MIAENYDKVQEDIKKVLRYIDKLEKKVNLIAVSKTVGIDDITVLLERGHRIFGENKVQEAIEKWLPLKEKYPDVELHLIGPLQSNKIKEAVKIFDVIQTVSSLSLAEKIKIECEKQDKKITFFVQINTGEEPQKSGLMPFEIDGFIKSCPLKISGLMCIPPQNQEPSVHFAMMKILAKRHNIPYLSQGMSSDYKEGIMLDADYIRVGTKIFGERL